MVLFAIGRYLCFALEGGPPCFLRDFSCPAVLRCRLYILRFRLPGFHRLWLFFPKDSANFFYRSDGPLPHKSFLLWFGLLPRSLAATWGISFDFFSSGYLDVSVHPVPFSCSMTWMTVHNHSRIAPFGYLRVIGYLRLSAAFRSLSRPSSADIAKASTICS